METTPLHALANWKDKKAYPGDNILADAPVALVQRLRSEGLSEAAIAETLWRWQFLRRHPKYQIGWFRRNRGDGYVYGLDCEFCPNPEDDYPAELSYYTDKDGNFCPQGHPEIRFVQQDPSTLGPILKMVQANLRASRPLMQFLFFELPHAKSGRKRDVRESDRVRCLRVLDALAAGASGAEIEHELYNETEKGKSRLVKRAREALIDYTGIPLNKGKADKP